MEMISTKRLQLWPSIYSNKNLGGRFKMKATVVSLLSTLMSVQVATALIAVLCLVLADFVLGVLTSLRAGEFKVNKLAQFL